MVGLAQLVEHQIVVLGVVGSNPTTHPILRSYELRIAGHSSEIDQDKKFQIFC